MVDDVADVLVTFGAFLVNTGFAVRKVANGDTALRLIASDPRFDVLVTDFAMPGLSGADLIEQAGQIRPQLKALVITGYPNADGLAELPPHTTILAKPFRRATLLAAVSSLLARRRKFRGRPWSQPTKRQSSIRGIERLTSMSSDDDRRVDRRWHVIATGTSDAPRPVRPLSLPVDDAPDVLTTTGVFLEAAGFDVVRACNGDAALASLASGQKFALLVTDYAMPGLNGVELAARALEKRLTLKVLIITGFPGTDGLSQLPPGVALLVKPFRRTELIARLKSWFGTGQVDLPESRN